MFTHTNNDTTTNSSKAVRRVLVGALAGSALAAGAALATATPADAAPSGTTIDATLAGAHVGASLDAQGATVTVRGDIDGLPLFNQPNTSRDDGLSEALPYSAWHGFCYTEGQWINDLGVQNNVWVKVNYDGERWLWAGGLRGDAHANVPNHC